MVWDARPSPCTALVHSDVLTAVPTVIFPDACDASAAAVCPADRGLFSQHCSVYAGDPDGPLM